MSSINIDSIKAKINEFLVKYPTFDKYLTMLHEKLDKKVEKPYLVIAVISVPILGVIFLGAGQFLIDLVGFVYPVYASIKSIESKEKEDDTQWLTYWLIFGLFKIIEGVADSIISFIPFYFIFKVLFLIWCYYPTTKGAVIVYNTLIKTYVVPLMSNDEDSDKSK